MKRLFLLATLFASVALAQSAPDVTFGVSVPPNSLPGKVTPTLTWSSTTPAPASCTASGGSSETPTWTGPQAASGSKVLGLVTKNTNFVFACTWPADTTATLTWTAPTVNVDNTPLTDLAGFKVYWNTGDPSLVTIGQTRMVTGPTNTSTVITNLPVGTWFFTVSACNSAGVCGDVSNVPSKVIGTSVTVTKNASIVFPGTAILTVK